jgi:flagellar biosynthetic protein FliQ
MEFDANIEHLRMAFWQVIITSGPILGIALGVGFGDRDCTSGNIDQ